MDEARAQTPDAASTARLAERRRDAALQASRESRLSTARLAIFGLGLVAAWFSLGVRLLHPAWLLPPAVAFVMLVILHDRVIRHRERADRGVAYYEAGLAQTLGLGGDATAAILKREQAAEIARRALPGPGAKTVPCSCAGAPRACTGDAKRLRRGHAPARFPRRLTPRPLCARLSH